MESPSPLKKTDASCFLNGISVQNNISSGRYNANISESPGTSGLNPDITLNNAFTIISQPDTTPLIRMPAGNHEIPETNHPQQHPVATALDNSPVQHDPLIDALIPWEPDVINIGFGINDDYLDAYDLFDDYAFLLEEPDGNPTVQPDREEAGRETHIEGMQPPVKQPSPKKSSLTRLHTPAPFSVNAIKKNLSESIERAARALQVATGQLEIISLGSAGVVFQCSYPDQTVEAVKFHCNHNSQAHPPNEIKVLNDLSTTPHEYNPALKAYIPVFKEARFCQAQKVWMHKMGLYPASLRDFLNMHPIGIPEPLARHFISDILQGLAILNELGYMHRDIKPENILLKHSFWNWWQATSPADTGKLEIPRPPLLVITDFDLTKKIKDTNHGAHTPNMATYQYRPANTMQGNYGASIDVSSTGMIFFELITGKKFIATKPRARPEHETKQAREKRKRKDQKTLEKEIRTKLTGGEAFSRNTKRTCKDLWCAWLKLSQSSEEDYPISQYCGLFYEVYGRDNWEGYLQEPSSIPVDKLSPQGFIALCDLLSSASNQDRVFSKPDRAKDQLNKPYWRNQPAISEALRQTRPEAMTLKAHPMATTDTTSTVVSNLTDIANDVEALFSEQERLLDLQEEENNWAGEMNMCCPHCPKGGFRHVRVWWRHINMHRPCPILACEETSDSLQALIAHIKKHSNIDRQALQNRLYEIKDKPVGLAGAEKKLLKQLADHTCWHKVDKNFCGQIFMTPSNLKNHRCIHTEDKPYQCEICGKTCNRKDALKKHQLVHSSQPRHACEHCEKTFARIEGLKKHLKTINREKIGTASADVRVRNILKLCPVPACVKTGSLHALIKHFKEHSQTDQQALKNRLYEIKDTTVGLAGAENTLLKQLADHTCWHKVDKDFCGKILIKTSDLKRHFRIHTKSVSTNARVQRKRHLNIHEPCPVLACKEKAGSLQALIKHIKQHSQTDQQALKNRLYKIKDKAVGLAGAENTLLKQLADHTCWHKVDTENFCGNIFRAPSNLKKHLRTHTGDRPYECAKCRKNFNRKEHLKLHQLTHTSAPHHECEHCGKKYTQITSLKRHLKTHTSEKPGSASTNVGIRQRHLNIHKPCPIPACKEKTGSLQALIKHIKQHSQSDQQALKNRLYAIKDKTIRIAEAENKLLKQLVDHTCWHKVDKGFCGNIFNKKNQMKDHQLIHTGGKPHECEHCGKKFHRKDNLQRHLRIHKKVRPFEISILPV